MSSAKTEETKQEKKSNGRSIFRRGSSRRVVKDDDSEPEMDRAESRDLDAPPEEDNQRGAGVSRGRNRHEEAEEKKKKRKEDLKKQQTCLYPDCKGKKRTDFDTCYKHRLNPRCAGDSEKCLKFDDLVKNYAVSNEYPSWRCEKHAPPPCPVQFASTEEMRKNMSIMFEYGRKYLYHYASGETGLGNTAETAFLRMTGVRATGTCEKCETTTVYHGPDGLKTCDNCFKVVKAMDAAAKSKQDDTYLVGFRFNSSLLLRLNLKTELKPESIFQYLAQGTLLFAGATDIKLVDNSMQLPTEEEEDKFHKDDSDCEADDPEHYDTGPVAVAVFQCKVTEANCAKLLTIDGKTHWNKVDEQLAAQDPKFASEEFEELTVRPMLATRNGIVVNKETLERDIQSIPLVDIDHVKRRILVNLHCTPF